MTNCREADGQAAIGRLQAGLDVHNAAAQRGYDIRFSVGALSREPSEQALKIDGLLQEADERMYERKRGKLAA